MDRPQLIIVHLDFQGRHNALWWIDAAPLMAASPLFEGMKLSRVSELLQDKINLMLEKHNLDCGHLWRNKYATFDAETDGSFLAAGCGFHVGQYQARGWGFAKTSKWLERALREIGTDPEPISPATPIDLSSRLSEAAIRAAAAFEKKSIEASTPEASAPRKSVPRM